MGLLVERSAFGNSRTVTPASLEDACRSRTDSVSMAEGRHLKVQRRQLTLTASPDFRVFEEDRVVQPLHVPGRVRCEQHPAVFTPQQRDLPSGMPRHMDDLQATRDGQDVVCKDLFVHDCRSWEGLLGHHHSGEHLLEAGRGSHDALSPEAFTHDPRVERVHVRRGAREVLEGGEASGVIRVKVRHDNVPNVLRLTSERTSGVKDAGLAAWDTGVDQDELTVVFEQEDVNHPE
nr:hypothetical protein [Deinococcus pimensis]